LRVIRDPASSARGYARPLGRALAPAAAALLLALPLPAQQPVTPTVLPWRSGPLDWTGPARPGGYLGVVGRAAAAFGREDGGFEVWAWPLKVLTGFELDFQTPMYPDPLRGRDIARRVEVTPAGATITYVHSAFTVRQHLFAPLEEPAVAMVLEVEAIRPLEIIARFRADLQYAWPAGFGGQYVFWNDELRAFVLSESRRQHNAIVGSPFATRATVHPAHQNPDAPSEIRIAVGDQAPVAMPRPGEPAGRLVNVVSRGIPIVVVARIAPRDSVIATYRRVLASLPALYAARADHADGVLAGTLGTDDPARGRLVRWAELNLDEAMACNPDLGCGPVAGYGAAGHGNYRPGFGWYFGGDAAINSLALSAVGAFDLVRPWLAFFARFQRADGKITHEISQGAGRVRWFEDYPYAFYHGDTTPFWLLAIGEFFRASADTAYVRGLWPNVVRAYEWSRATDADGDGLMENGRAGAGAIEVGDLGIGLKSDIYMAAVWVESLRHVAAMAAAVGDTAVRADAERRFPVALRSLETRFWMPSVRRFAFALLEGDRLNENLTVWPATAMSWRLFDEERGQAMSAALARATIATDWGGRTLAAESELYDPLHYNNGTVWPFVTGFLALAQYRYHNVYAAADLVDAVGRTFDVWGLGRNPEVFSGAAFEPLETSVPQQFFATSQYLNPLVRGAWGLEADAPAGALAIAPHLFAEPGTRTVTGVRVGTTIVDVTFDVRDTLLGIAVRRRAGEGPLVLRLDPALAPGATLRGVTVDGRTVQARVRDTGRDVHVGLDVPLGGGPGGTVIAIRHSRGWRLEVGGPALGRGERSRRLKILDARTGDGALVLDAEGRAGWRYPVRVISPAGTWADTLVAEAAGADPRDGYVRMERRLRRQGRFP
jgi:glycogen debranching enzyme